MAALAWANHINHISGVIAADYGDRFGLEYWVVDYIAENGLGVLENEND